MDLTKQYVLGDPAGPGDDAGTDGPRGGAGFVRGQIARRGARARRHISSRGFPHGPAGHALHGAAGTHVDVTIAWSVMMDESFGPVVGIMKVSGDEEASR